MSRLQSRIVAAIETAASDANCCGCYSESAAQAVMAVLIREGGLASDAGAAKILKADRAAKAERKRRKKERRESDERSIRSREEMLNRIDPTNTRSTLRQMGWTMSSISIAPNGLTQLEMWGPNQVGEIETASPEMAFPAFLAEVLKSKGGSAK